jgi:hypothetical protein
MFRIVRYRNPSTRPNQAIILGCCDAHSTSEMGQVRRSGQEAPRVRSISNTRPLVASRHTAVECRFCCKSPKLPGANFPAITQSDLKPPIFVASLSLGRSPVSLSLGDEVPHIFTRKSRLRPGKFLITGAKRVLQQNRHEAAVYRGAASSRVLEMLPTLGAPWPDRRP